MDQISIKSEDVDISKFRESDSFWELESYKRVVKRIDDGLRLCNDLSKMAQERSEIEAKYAKYLQQWSKKWEEIISKGPEYGSTEIGWKAPFEEASKLSDKHMDMSVRITDEVVKDVEAWKNNAFHKSLVHIKESKKADDDFTNSQKPWAKRLIKCIKAKKAYHQAAREVESLAVQVNTADTSPEISAEHTQRLRAKHERAEGERDRALEKYKDRLANVQRYRSK